MSKSRFSFPLHYQIVAALILGVCFGYLLPEVTNYTNWIGDVFLRGLNMVVVPLILLSITTGVASVGSGDNLGRLGLKTMGYYLLSTLIAILTGFVLVNLIKPGVGAELGFKMPVENLSAVSDSFGTTLIKIVPSNIFEALSQGQMLSITVLIGLMIHGLITLPLTVKILGRANPIKHLKNMTIPFLTAFSTSSSNATLPLTMEAVEFDDGVSNKIASFTLPLGATVNMNGTALYECVAVIFIAQAYGVNLTFGQQLIVIFTALLAAIGSAGIPMAGLVMMTVVLKAVGLPLEGIGLILAVDRVLDMFRTTINVYGDTCCAVIIAKSEGEILKV